MAKKSSAKASGQAATTAATQRQPKKKVKKRQQVKKDPHGNVFVVLVQDVPHLGRQGDVVRVRPGYARNYLYPYGLAVAPTEENLRRLEQYKIQVQKAREAKIADLKVLAEQLSRLPVITIEANANEEGHLYGSIGPVEISKYLKGKNLLVEPEMIRMEQHIKEANTIVEVPVHLGYSIEAKIQVAVIAATRR
jgi:large subunit ribosomal protein L9